MSTITDLVKFSLGRNEMFPRSNAYSFLFSFILILASHTLAEMPMDVSGSPRPKGIIILFVRSSYFEFDLFCPGISNLLKRYRHHFTLDPLCIGQKFLSDLICYSSAWTSVCACQQRQVDLILSRSSYVEPFKCNCMLSLMATTDHLCLCPASPKKPCQLLPR